MKTRFRYLFSLVLILVSFQNCSKIDVKNIQRDLGSTAVPEIPEVITSGFLTLPEVDVLIETDFEVPKTFNLNSEATLPASQVTISDATSMPIKGRLININIAARNFTYTPAHGFRGNEKANVKIRDTNNKEIMFKITFRVGNALSSFEPALAVRGVGCILCHANIKSNIITDFGLGSEYYFGGTASGLGWNSGNIYGNHAENLRSISLTDNKSIFVPAITLPNSAQTLKAYVQSELNLGSSSAAVASEKNKIYIGAPVESDLTAAFHITNERSKYFKNDSNSSPDLIGLMDSNNFFQVIGNFSCDGDVFIRGPLYLDNLKIKTLQGCRLYVVGSVFLYGEIQYVDASNINNNLQITSTKSINVGLGTPFNKAGKLCDVNTHAETVRSGSSLRSRYVDVWTVPSQFVRSTTNPKAYGQSILAEAGLIESQIGALPDASCRPEGRTVHYEKLLLNAPAVNSRYTGNFSGTVIAEYAIMALGAFKFEFDPVFKLVPVLPVLDASKYLKVGN